MKKIDVIKEQAYMILDDLAFCFKYTDGLRVIIVYNLRNIAQYSIFIICDDDDKIRLKECSMSEANKYKSLFFVERNKDELIRGFKEWENKIK